MISNSICDTLEPMSDGILCSGIAKSRIVFTLTSQLFSSIMTIRSCWKITGIQDVCGFPTAFNVTDRKVDTCVPGFDCGR